MKTRVGDPALRREVEAAVRRRVRGDEAEDVVQATFADVLSATNVPEQPEEFRRFVFGVARNKVYDHFRRQRRLVDGLDADEEAAPEAEAPLSARDMLRWAEGELPDSESQSTLEWMLREGDGEKLEHIARDARVPAPRVRKRVSRLRKLLRERWAAQLALAIALVGGIGARPWLAWPSPNDVVKREPVPMPGPSSRLPEPSRPAGEPSAVPSPSAAPVPSGLDLPSPIPSASAVPSALPSPSARVPSPKPTAQRSVAPVPTENAKTARVRAPSKVGPSKDLTWDSSSNPAPEPKNSDSIDFGSPKSKPNFDAGTSPRKPDMK